MLQGMEAKVGNLRGLLMPKCGEDTTGFSAKFYRHVFPSGKKGRNIQGGLGPSSHLPLCNGLPKSAMGYCARGAQST